MKTIRTYTLLLCVYFLVTETHGFTSPYLDSLRGITDLHLNEEEPDDNTGIGLKADDPTEDPCLPNPCQNTGKCKHDGESFICDCTKPFSGDRCEIDPCLPNPCQNTGTCKHDGESFICDCTKPFSGDRCEIDPCASGVCQNGGLCTIEKNNFRCYCKSPYNGTTCEGGDDTPHSCNEEPCRNEGDCFKNGTDYICRCKNGFTDKYCTTSEWCRDNEKTVCGEVPCEYDSISNTSFCFCEKPQMFNGKKQECGECDCGPKGNCSFDETTGIKTCNCDEGHIEITNGTCQECNCGTNGTCSFNEKGEKSCDCEDGYLLNANELCQECYCGDNGTCSFDDDGKKNCTCFEDHILNNKGICLKCDCGPNGTCSFDSSDQPKCKCEEGYVVNNKGICKECDCGAEGTCSFDNSQAKQCHCKKGYIEYKGECTVCNCGPKGNCSFNNNGKKKCICEIGHILNTDEICYDPCALGVCKNGGLCTIENNNIRCYCKSSYNGITCEEEVHEHHACDDHPCQNGGDCFKNGTNYICICKNDFYDTNCTLSQWCKDNKDSVCGSANCVYDDNIKKSFCSCKSTQTFDAKNRKCKDIDQCLIKYLKRECMSLHEMCKKGGTCECENNYKYGEDNKTCVFDACKSKPCGSNSVCEENGDRSFTCSCEKGYVHMGTTCKKMDLCSPGITDCEQVCKNGVCFCEAGFYLNDDKKTCSMNVGTKLCKKECGVGKCVLKGKEEVCICHTITHVLNVDGICIDRCVANALPTNTCPTGINCVSDAELGFRCNCSGKYKQANDRIHCEVKDMCTEGDGEVVCEKLSARCVAKPNSKQGYICECENGYDQDRTKGNRCTHKCKFEAKATECLKRLSVCEIEELDGKYNAICKCPPLFTNKTTNKCDKRADYSFTGKFKVQRETYEMSDKVNNRFKRSLPPIDYIKLNKDFKESLKNVYANYQDSKVLKCSGDETDLDCSLEMQLSKEPSKELNIITTPSVCMPIEGSNYCLVPPRLIMEQKTEDEVFSVTSPCDEDIKNRLCGTTTDCQETSNKKGFQCLCKPGFVATGAYKPFAADEVSSIQNCNDVNECLKDNPCPNTTECFNLYGTYDCLCKDSFRKKDNADIKKEGCVAVCNPNPCVHGSCNTTGNHGFSCNCDSSYTGFLCDEPNTLIANLKETLRRHSALIGGILGALLVLAIIISVVLFRKLKKKSGDDEDDYLKHRKRGILSEMGKLGRRQPKPADEDIEVERRNIPTIIANESGDYRRQYRDSDFAIPRPQVSEKQGSGDYRRGYSGDERMFQKSSPPRQTNDEPVQSRRPLSRSADRLDADERRLSSAQYKNRAYEEE